MTEKLMPCPFCGGAAVRKADPGVVNVLFGLVVDHVPGCFLAMPFPTDDEAVDLAWNTRHPTPAADEVEAVARAIGQKLYGWGLENEVTDFARDMARAAIAAMQSRSAEPASNRCRLPEAEPAPVSREIAAWNTAIAAGLSQDAAIARVRALPTEPAGEEPVDLAGHTADAVRDWCRIVLGKVVTFDDSRKIADGIISHVRSFSTPTNPERLEAALAILREIKSQCWLTEQQTEHCDTPYIYPELYARMEAAISAAPLKGDA